jgi:hypothetical protein
MIDHVHPARDEDDRRDRGDAEPEKQGIMEVTGKKKPEDAKNPC